jgi:hypothetical protein
VYCRPYVYSKSVGPYNFYQTTYVYT